MTMRVRGRQIGCLNAALAKSGCLASERPRFSRTTELEEQAAWIAVAAYRGCES